nr:hypothetical protein [Tanacetum cinerariifolium]
MAPLCFSTRLGLGTRSHGRLGGVIWYCSGVMGCTVEACGEDEYLGGKVGLEAEVDSLVRSSTPIMTTATTVTSTVDSTLVAKEKPVKPSLFAADSSSVGGADPNTGVFSDLTGSDFLKAEAAETIRLRAHTSNLEAVEKSFWDEVNVLKGRNVILEKERDALDVKVTDLEASVVGKERDLTDLNAQLTYVKSQNDSIPDQVHELEVSFAKLQEKIPVYDNCMEQLEKFQDDWMKVVDDKLAKLDLDLAKMACHLEEKVYPHLLNTISGRRWLLTYGLKLFLVKCLNSSEYLTALRAAISHAIEKGMQSGLAVNINHGREDRSLADVATYNPDAEANFNTALQELRALADVHGMKELQPDVEQLKVPIHRSEDQEVLGETSLSFAFSVSHSHVERIRENIAA